MQAGVVLDHAEVVFSMPLKARGSVNSPLVPQFGQAMSARPFAAARPVLLLEGLDQVVGAEPLVAVLALGERVGERRDVAGGLPHLRARG